MLRERSACVCIHNHYPHRGGVGDQGNHDCSVRREPVGLSDGHAEAARVTQGGTPCHAGFTPRLSSGWSELVASFQECIPWWECWVCRTTCDASVQLARD